MKTVRLATFEMHVVDQGTGVPLLLVHGFPLDHRMWLAQIETFSRTHRVIAPDLRGFGRSRSDDDAVSMEQYADDLAEMLDRLGVVERVVLCGLSMGGYIAWQFWKKHALRMRALVVCDTRAAADSPEARANRMKMVEHVLRAGGTQYVAEAMLPKLFAPGAQERVPNEVDLMRQTILASSPRAVAAALRGMADRPDMTGELKNISLPTQVIVGEHDALSTAAEMRTLAAAIPGAKFSEIRGSGHMTPLEHPAEFNAILASFLAELPA